MARTRGREYHTAACQTDASGRSYGKVVGIEGVCMLAFESEKTMFEIYRDHLYTGRYRVVYFTELQDHNKETEINHALAGEHFFDGYLRNFRKEEAKRIIAGLLERMNAGEALSPEDIRAALGEHLA